MSDEKVNIVVVDCGGVGKERKLRFLVLKFASCRFKRRERGLIHPSSINGFVFRLIESGKFVLRAETHGDLARWVFFDLAEKRFCVVWVVLRGGNSSLRECYIERVESIAIR